MICMHCSGTLRRSTAPLRIDRRRYHLAFNAVPSWICGKCGERYFDEREVDAVQGAIQSLDEQTRRIATDVA